MNVNQIQPPPQPQLQTFSKDASQKDADFLSLKLLNRRSRLRLSPEPIPLDDLPPTTRLFAVANSRRWFAAAVRASDASYALFLSPLADLRVAFTSSTSDGPLALNPSTTIALQTRIPHIVIVTRDDSRILVAFTDGSIGVFGWSTPAPLFTFSPSGPKPVRGIFPSTGDSHIVAILRDSGIHPSVELLDVHNMVSVGAWNSGGSPGTNVTSVSWSPKGKQIAIGLENGDVVTFSPSDTSSAKSIVPHPLSVDGQSVISLQWLSNTEFHGIYAAASSLAPDSEQTHLILSLEPKANFTGDIKLATPYLPFPGLRPPGSFVVMLKNWEPYRFLLFIGDSTSSDVGLIGSLANATSPAESWYNLALEEDSTPSVPLDKDLNETVLLGLELDVTDTETFRYTGVSGEVVDVPAPPIMYLYASDGTLTGWHIIQTQGVPYPDMSASATPVPSSPAATTTLAPQSSALGASQSTSTTSPATTGTGAFVSVPPSNVTAIPSSGGAFGFSAFSGTTPAFGTTSFGFSQQSQPQEPQTPSPFQAPPLSAPTMSVEMTSATDDSMASETESGFGGLSLGGGSGGSKTGTTNSMFGPFGNTAQQVAPSAFGSGGPNTSPTFETFGSGPVKPAVGFGAFAGTGSSAFGSSSGFGGSVFRSGGAFSSGASNAGSGAFSTTQPPSVESKPTSGFGQSDFSASGTNPAFGSSSFGQSSFGQSPAFGKSAFSSSSFGTPTSSQPGATSTFGSGANAGGFAAFASQGTSSFGAVAQRSTDSKPVWAASDTSQGKPQESTSSTPSTFGDSSGTNAFSSSTTAETSSTTASTPARGAFAGLSQSNKSGTSGGMFGQTTFGSPSLSQSAFGQSSFGQSSALLADSTKSTVTGTFGGGGGFGSFATGPSAFGTTLAKDAKPAWAAAPSGITSEKQPSTVFGLRTSVTTPSAFSSTPSASSATTDTTTPSTSPEKTVLPVSTPLATPPVTSKATSDTKTPAAVTSTSTTPPSAAPASVSAFGSLKTSSTGFSSLQPGFGAFGSGNTTPSSSPFSQKSGGTSTTLTSLFESVGAATTTPQSKVGAPKFGASSFGTSSFTSTGFFGKSSASTSTIPTTPETPPNVASKSAFSTFGGSPSPFGATSGSSGKSFGDLLRQKEGEKFEDEKRDEGFSRTAEEWKRPVSVFAQLKEAAAETGKDGEDKDADGEEEGPGDTSFRSFEDGSEGEDVLDDFLKSDEEDLPSEEEGDGEEEELEVAEVADDTGDSGRTAGPATPAAKRLVQKPSSVFGISFTPASPTEPKDHGESSKPPFTRAASTTPPGSPAAGELGSAPAVSRAASAPPAGVPGLTPGLLGIGRPSTRPTRSSPLASRPISGDDEGDEEEEEPSHSPLETKKARSASPAVPVSVAAPSRPKTPPALFGPATAPPKAVPFMLSPATSPITKPPSSDGGKPSDTGKSALSGPATCGAGLPSTPVSQGGFFAQQPLGSVLPSAATPTAVPAAGQKPCVPTPSSVLSSPFTKPGSPANTPPPSSPASAFPLATSTSTHLLGLPQVGGTPAPRPESPAQSMLTEFTHLYNTLTRDLDDLKTLATQASLRAAQLRWSDGRAKTADDLTEPTKWVMSDLTQFNHIVKQVELGLEKWEKEKATCILHLRDLESDMLKGSTREEEVERFSKASKDAEFARMLKQRTLTPDHLETQVQLRRDVRAIRGRIQQLEEYIQASKKKLNSVKNGKPSFKPPSLDTINRTYRNIDAAIEQEEDDLANLAERIAQLELTTTQFSSSASARDRRLPDRNNQRVGREVTPNIAASTAAALNAERSAQKLKKALLSARKQPLLNTKAVDAIPQERGGKGQKALQPDFSLNAEMAFAAGLNSGITASTSGGEPSTPQWSAPPRWSLPAFNIDLNTSPTSGLSGGRSRGQREKQHAKPIQMNQGVKSTLPPPPAGFSWGPVPIIQPKTTISILAGFGNLKGKGKEENGLSDSWVADDFGK
ncbi:transporter [Ganoderma sinense ZZ0214-1]|uniref:Transporter n=1 Tax=Ganoderma sinense ZZ0214-1 TaxID=1077348 RepID=A0A2G8S828_9APHY|nr:transporter [Ganoderma sinense ZZ0214-1]